MTESTISAQRTSTAAPTVVVSLLTIATAFSYGRIFRGWEFLPQFGIVAVSIHFFSYLFRRMRLPFVISLLLIAALTYAVTCYLYLRKTLSYGIPLAASWNQLWLQMTQSWDLLGKVVTPVALQSGFGLTGALSIGLIAFFADSFAFRFSGRIETVIPAVALFITLSALGIDRYRIVSSVIWVGAACITVAVLRLPNVNIGSVGGPSVGTRSRFRPPQLSIIVLAIAASIIAGIITPKIPGATREAWLSARVNKTGSQLSPFIDLRDQLFNPTDASLFTVVTDRPSYWRITSLPNFDGDTWSVNESLLNDAGGSLFDPSTITDVGVSVTEQSQQVTIDDLTGNFAPVGFRPTQLNATSRNLFYEPDTGTLLVDSSGLAQQDSYSVISAAVVPSPDSLTTSRSDSPPNPAYLRLPQTPRALAEIAKLQPILDEIVKDSDNNYERLLAVQSYFRDNFAYTLDVPAAATGATEAFIERRSGFCEQFASTFALFARMIDIPSRVAIGFTPGESVPIGSSALNTYTVRSQHAHAWPEVWFNNIGWVLFEPTPGRGAPQAVYTNVPPAQDDSLASSATTLTPDTTGSTVTTGASQSSSTIADSSPTDSSTALLPEDVESISSASSRTSRSGIFFFFLALLILLSWVLLVPPWANSQARKKEPDPRLRTWRSTIAHYEFLHGPISTQSTVTQLSQLLSQQPWIDRNILDLLTTAITALLYQDSRPSLSDHLDPQNVTPRLGTTDQSDPVIVAAWRDSLSWRQRALGRVNPVVALTLAGGPRSGNAASGR